jgi:nicotinamidase-related amidase
MAGPDPRKLLGNQEKTALLVIDMQNDFVLPGAPLATPRGLDVVPVIAAFADAARARGFPVVYTQEMHRPEGDDFGIELAFEPPHCLEGSPGVEIVEGIKPQPGDLRIGHKRRYNGFFGTELDLVLRCRGIENLLITGVCTDICVISTVHHARDLDYRCFVIEEAVDGTTAERHKAGLLRRSPGCSAYKCQRRWGPRGTSPPGHETLRDAGGRLVGRSAVDELHLGGDLSARRSTAACPELRRMRPPHG